jgi:hypothetical protein
MAIMHLSFGTHKKKINIDFIEGPMCFMGRRPLSNNFKNVPFFRFYLSLIKRFRERLPTL